MRARALTNVLSTATNGTRQSFERARVRPPSPVRSSRTTIPPALLPHCRRQRSSHCYPGGARWGLASTSSRTCRITPERRRGSAKGERGEKKSGTGSVWGRRQEGAGTRRGRARAKIVPAEPSSEAELVASAVREVAGGLRRRLQRARKAGAGGLGRLVWLEERVWRVCR